ncbi:uncharacterized protein EI90DRAFT_3032590 [Cantharellus anzutake]|uniref:uncharacterized protein n=1 Tax=Cantharellus anzutake TaxID=1750568 RepID=UPI0019083091|nr:uncharacterized protein EI90DRAFT_3032590 [Cantharellus anzutake]KAF8342243.1 hypothetical protein EI90DRAFT_3032590 [Cantharellus anzutake]
MAIHQTTAVVSSTTVQSFFAYRVYTLSKSIIWGCLVMLLSLTQFGLGIGVVSFTCCCSCCQTVTH